MTTLLWVRHGETEANRGRLIQGRNDTPLTAAGRAATGAVAAKIAGLIGSAPPPVTYCSPLPRARETLRLICGHLGWDGPVTEDKRLMEIDFGRHTGRKVAEILPLILHHKRHPERPYPGGESGADLGRRVHVFVADIRAAHRDRTVLVVTHFGVIETALRRAGDIPIRTPVRPAHDRVYRMAFGAAGVPEVTVV